MKRFILLLAVLALLLTGCSSSGPAEGTLTAMDTYMSIRIWGEKRLLSEVSDMIYEMEGLFSVTDEGSEIYALNQNGTARVSPRTLDILEKAMTLSERTDGAFDPTVYPMVKAWGFTTGDYTIPESEVLAALSVGTEYIHTDGQIISLEEGVQLDLGGIAKGYTAQACIEMLDTCGIEAAILTLGGNVQTLGSKPNGEEWRIGIADPNAPSEAIVKLHFTGSMALVTSGGYQRYFEEGGIRYHHIIDPATGCPAETDLLSVTILTGDGTTADALSTALYVMGSDAALDFWRTSDDFEAVLILEDGSILATEGAAPLLYDCEFTTVSR